MSVYCGFVFGGVVGILVNCSVRCGGFSVYVYFQVGNEIGNFLDLLIIRNNHDHGTESPPPDFTQDRIQPYARNQQATHPRK
jgi:hypothetical protein